MVSCILLSTYTNPFLKWGFQQVKMSGPPYHLANHLQSIYRARIFPLVVVASVFVANMNHFVFCSPTRVAVLCPGAIRLFPLDYQT